MPFEGSSLNRNLALTKEETMSNLATFTPLLRQSVGFDRFHDLFESLMDDRSEQFDAYPPFNIEKLGEDAYRITLAVAGFSESDLNIVVENDTLSVSAQKGEKGGNEKAQYLHRGIAARAFERTFRLADHIKVEEAKLDHGLLIIHLEREIPEEKRPRMVPIGSSDNFAGDKNK